MADCSGYGFGTTINLCVDGPVGNGNSANLQITFGFINGGGYSFDSNPVNVSNWDGSEITVDVSSNFQYGLASASCSTITANLTLTPTKNNYGTALIEIYMDGCVASGSGPQVFENCGGVGPHLMSEMSTFRLNGLSCVV